MWTITVILLVAWLLGFTAFHAGGSSAKLNFYPQFGMGKGSSGSESGHFISEGKLGLAETPDFKATTGWTIGK